MDMLQRAEEVSRFMGFVGAMRQVRTPVGSTGTAAATTIRQSLEDHYRDDQGKPAVHVTMESALYDDAPAIVAMWEQFDHYDSATLRRYRQLVGIELAGLSTDRHPRKIFDRSPFGIIVLIIGTVTVWMTFLRLYSGDDLEELLAVVRFNWIVGLIWVVGLFVVVWYIIRTHRNNVQTAHLASIARALDLYLDD